MIYTQYNIITVLIILTCPLQVREALGKLLDSHQDLQTRHNRLKRDFDQRTLEQQEERHSWSKERMSILSQLNETQQDLQRVSERCSELEQ